VSREGREEEGVFSHPAFAKATAGKLD